MIGAAIQSHWMWETPLIATDPAVLVGHKSPRPPKKVKGNLTQWKACVKTLPVRGFTVGPKKTNNKNKLCILIL